MAPLNIPEATIPSGFRDEVELLGESKLKLRKEVLYDGDLYDITDFIDRHPGGRLIEFYTEGGEDATMAIQQFHNRSFSKVSGIMKSLKRRPVENSDNATTLVDSERQKRNDALTADFADLYKQLKKDGYFEPSPAHICYRLAELGLFAGMACVLITYESLLLKMLAAFSLAIFGGRCGWLMHEAGHNSLTGNPKIDKIIGAFVMGFGVGGSMAWWNSHHNRHHAMPQRLSRDVDLEAVPLFVFNAKAVRKDQNGKGFFLKYQAYLFLSVDAFLVVLFWNVYMHPRAMIRRRKYLEMFFTLFHYVLMYHMGLYPALFAMWFAGSYMFGNFGLSHSHLPVASEPQHWVEYSLVHTMDIEPSWFVNWWMGYLNCQIEHHLFPSMPQFRQPRMRHLVKALAQKHNLPYQSCSYFEALKKTLRNLNEVSQELQNQ